MITSSKYRQVLETGAAAGGGITALTGDVTATGPGSVPATLANSGVSAGSAGSVSSTPVITVDAKGRITVLSSATIKQTPTVSIITTTGNIDDLDFSNADVIWMNNATDSTIRGLLAGVDGQKVIIHSKGAGNVLLAHQNAGSSENNRLINIATSSNTPLAAGVGSVTYIYDGTTARWRLDKHSQGAFLQQPYNSGDFTANGSMTWTVDSGDVINYAYYLEGNKLTVVIDFEPTTIGGTVSTQLIAVIPGGFTAIGASRAYLRYNNPGLSIGHLTAGGTSLICATNAGGNWALGTNNVVTAGQIVFPVT